MMKISMIGYGHMAKALCQGLLKNPTYHIKVAAPSLVVASMQPQLMSHSDNVAILATAQIVILAVKPAQMAGVLAEIAPHLHSEQLIISVAAGLNLAWFESHLPEKTPVVRAIPNLAAACGESATPLLANRWVTPDQHALATKLFQQCGQIAWTQEEKDLDTITALSGSGLAYLFLFVQAMSDGATTLGLSSDVAHHFAIQTLAGAARLATLGQHSLPALQQQVTSKAGTTAAALEVFTQHRLADTVLEAMRAAIIRSQTLRTEEK